MRRYRPSRSPRNAWNQFLAQPYDDSDQSLAVRADFPVKYFLATMSGKVAAVDKGSTATCGPRRTRRSTNSRISVL